MEKREKFRKWMQEFSEGSDLSSLDELDRKALEGYEYLDKESSFDDAMKRLDQRFQSHVAQTSSSQIVEKKEAKVRSIARRRYLALAAAFALLCAAAIWVFNQPPSGEQLFAAHFDAPQSPYLLTARGNGNAGSDLAGAFALYEKGEYADAADAISPLVDKYPDKEDLPFYQAICLMASYQIEKAIPILKGCLDTDFQNIDDKSKFYLGLAYLKLEDPSTARQWLTQALDGVMSDEATEILETID